VVIFFCLSVAFFALAAIADSQQPGTISIYVWGRAITELVLGMAYFLFAYLWRRGKFWGYLRMLMTSALTLLSTLSVVALDGSYPWWLRLEQALQTAVILLLAYLLTRPDMRARFRKKHA
jgi:peptidoglycan/LPS O-acetylase OafA/YrhL